MNDLEKLAVLFEQGVKDLELDAVICVGGDGSMNIIGNYCKNTNVKMIGIPKTIDGDTPITEASVGFETAVQVCTSAIDSLELTARSHQRAIILEVMGRDAGHLAMNSSIAGFADVCLVPEIPYTIDGVIEKLKQVKASGRDHAIIVISEGLTTENGEHISSAKNCIGEAVYGGIGQYLSAEINKRYPDFQTRVNVLGHLQRSGTPCAFDRLLASAYGVKAIELLNEGKSNQMVIWKNGKVDSVSIENVIKEGTALLNKNSDYVKTAVSLGMYIGEI